MHAVAVPIVVNCECGEVLRASAGDVVRCESCGRSYDTKALASSHEAIARSAKARDRALSRLGIGVVGASCIVVFMVFSYTAALIALPLLSVVWWGGVQPLARRAFVARMVRQNARTIEAR